jgi:predicted transcriptional regulator
MSRRRSITFRLAPESLARFDALAAADGRDRSSAIRQAMAEWVQRQEEPRYKRNLRALAEAQEAVEDPAPAESDPFLVGALDPDPEEEAYIPPDDPWASYGA